MIPNKELLIDLTEIMAQYRPFTGLLDFYPNALRGIVHRCLCIHVYSKIHGNNCDASAVEFKDAVMDMYFTSAGYRARQLDYPNDEPEHTIEHACDGLIAILDDKVEEHLDFFRHMPIDTDCARWVGDHLLLEMHYNDTRIDYAELLYR